MLTFVFVVIGVLFFVGSVSLPWYVEVVETDFAQTTVSTSAVQFWYISKWQGCSESCDVNLEVEFWEFGDDQEIRTVYGISWGLSVLAFISAFGVMITGKSSGSVGVIITAILALATFFFVTPAYNDDSMLCSSGPCDSFTGSESSNNMTYYWGPSLGWYSTLLGLVWMIVVLVVGTCCCLVTSCNKRSKYNEIPPSHYEAPPVTYKASTTAEFHQPKNSNGNFYTKV